MQLERSRRWLPLAPALALALTGCGTVKQSGTVRTGTEQLLLTNSWDDAVQKIDFRPLAGVPVFLDAQYVTAVDQGWVVSSLRQAMLAQGVLLRAKPEQAQWVVEARVGSYGTDSYNWLVGVQQMTIPVSIGGLPSGTIPEIPIVKKTDQWAISKLAVFAYDRASGQMVWSSGTQLATASAKDVYVGGLGPIQSGSIRQKGKRVGINLPMISDPEPSLSTGAKVPTRPAAPGTDVVRGADGGANPPAATMTLPPSATDLESFRP